MASSGSKALLVGLIGLAAGLTIGLLFAPAKGSKTRKRLKKKAMNLADSLQENLSDKVGAFKSALGKKDEDPDED